MRACRVRERDEARALRIVEYRECRRPDETNIMMVIIGLKCLAAALARYASEKFPMRQRRRRSSQLPESIA